MGCDQPANAIQPPKFYSVHESAKPTQIMVQSDAEAMKEKNELQTQIINLKKLASFQQDEIKHLSQTQIDQKPQQLIKTFDKTQYKRKCQNAKNMRSNEVKKQLMRLPNLGDSVLKLKYLCSTCQNSWESMALKFVAPINFIDEMDFCDFCNGTGVKYFTEINRQFQCFQCKKKYVKNVLEKEGPLDIQNLIWKKFGNPVIID